VNNFIFKGHNLSRDEGNGMESHSTYKYPGV